MARRSKKTPPAPPAPRRAAGPARRVWLAVLVGLVGLVAVVVARRQFQSGPTAAGVHRKDSPSLSPIIPPESQAFAAYAGSASCRECHASAFDRWKDSHHGLAERAVDPALDRGAFEPARAISHGTQTAEARHGPRPRVGHGRSRWPPAAFRSRPRDRLGSAAAVPHSDGRRALADGRAGLRSALEQVVQCLRRRRSQARRMGPLDGARHELEHDVRRLPQHARPQKLPRRH